ncbi:hypothetical protein [Nocardioides sp.]|uniref:hypothetical protein n=1 Tax=Nocardioides sp. TaxID=35761 RepID=UPI003514A33E
MSREWQPGDVAILNDGRRVFIATDPSDHTLSAIDANGMWYSRLSMAARAARPLAVVDPEQPIPDEWVNVFREVWQTLWGVEDAARAGLAALFAHIANPPQSKPDEPKVFGACVRDRDGAVWLRVDDDAAPWCNEHYVWHAWDDLDIPEDGILWHGVGGDS